MIPSQLVRRAPLQGDTARAAKRQCDDLNFGLGSWPMNLREQYLSAWKAYPQYRQGVGARVESVTDSKMVLVYGNQLMTVVEGGEVCLQSGNDEPWRTLGMKDLSQILKAGDWLLLGAQPSVSETELPGLKSLLLASPNRSEGSSMAQISARQFCLFVEDVRKWFLDQGFFPAQTPSLVTCPGMEPPLVPFQVETDSNAPAFLPTSPELHLKKLLCRGYGDVFEIKRVFRREMVTPHHQPEFLMLEWYRNFSNLEAIKQDLKKLIRFLDQKGWNQSGTDSENWVELTVSGMFQEHLGFSLKPETTHEELLQLAREQDVGFHSEDDSWDDTFFKVFLSRLETQLEAKGLATLQDYPPTQAALARLNEAGWAERMEFYISGVEVGNAFDELNDPDLQRQRFEKDQQERRDRGLVDLPIDEEFLEDLKKGLPPAAGIAVGLERLFMGLMGIKEISVLTEFPKVNQED